VLKGAKLLATWFHEPHRATRDVDLLGFGNAAEDALLGTFREMMCHLLERHLRHLGVMHQLGQGQR